MFERVVCLGGCALAVSIAVVACSQFDGADSTAPTSDDAGNVDKPDTEGDASADSSVRPLPGPDAGVGRVDGIVRGTGFPGDPEDGQPGRTITLVDARGQKFTATTAADGKFQLPSVAVPYDVRVHAKEGPGTAWIGVTRRDVQLRAYRDAPSTTCTSVKTTLNMTVQYPACPSDSCDLDISIHSADGRASGGLVTGYTAGMTSGVWSPEASWCSLPGTTAPAVTVDVLVSNRSYSTFFYRRLGPYAAQPNGSVQVGSFSVPSVPTIGTLTATTNELGVPSGWRRDVQVFLGFPGGGVGYLARASATSIASGIPNIPGSTVSVSAYASDPLLTGNQQDQCSATVDNLPVTATSTTQTLVKGPAVSPLPASTVAKSAFAVAWTPVLGAPPALVQFQVFNVTPPSFEASVWAEKGPVALSRLEALGLSVSAGEKNFELYTIGARTLDDAVKPGPALPPYSGSRSSIRHVFTIAP